MLDKDAQFFLDDTILQQLSEFQFLPLAPQPSRMHFDDIFKDDTKLLNFQALKLPQNIEDIETFYDETGAHELTNERSAVALHVISHLPYPIHFAARDGNIQKIELYTQQGFDVNQQDLHSITPLHVAALFGQLAASHKLIELGANVNATGYEDHTPLHFALIKKHFDIAQLLLSENADPLKVDYNGKNGFTLICDQLYQQVMAYDPPSNTKLAKIIQVINLIDKMIDNSQGLILYGEQTIIENEPYVTPLPAALILQCIATFAPTQDVADKTLSLVEKIKQCDSSWQSYLYAKDLLHRFPTGELYQAQLDSKHKIWFASEGHIRVFTTELAASSLGHFIAHMENQDNALKIDVFTALKNIYDHASEFAQHAALAQTPEKALTLYHQGETILLPSGWDGHFVDIILSKNQALYVTANSGDRYHGEAPAYEPDPPGIIFYKLHEPEKISNQFIVNILTNTERMTLEYENPYEYGIIEKIDDIVRENQTYGNCGWESHRNAVEGLIYIELLNRHLPTTQAKVLANTYYEEWDRFHGNFVIDQYMSCEPSLPFKAMLDILYQIHLKDNFTETDRIHSQKIANTFLTSHYIDDFQAWISQGEHDLTRRLMLNILQEQHGIDIHHLASQPPIHEVVAQSSELAPMVQHVPLAELIPEPMLI